MLNWNNLDISICNLYLRTPVLITSSFWSPDAGVEYRRVQPNSSLPSAEANEFPKGASSYNKKKINPDGRQFKLALETIIQTWKEILVVVKTKRCYWPARIVHSKHTGLKGNGFDFSFRRWLRQGLPRRLRFTINARIPVVSVQGTP